MPVAMERLPGEDMERCGGGLPTQPNANPQSPFYGSLLALVFEGLCEDKLDGPAFIIDHPVEVSPLAKQKPEDPRFTERFELYLGGMEIANAFSELNDPDVQAERFRQQLAAREAGDAEAHRFDADYIRALEHAHAPGGRRGDRSRPADHGVRRSILDPRRDSLPAPAPRGLASGRRGVSATPSFPLLLARRYLRSARRDAFTSFLSGVAAGGIGLGVAALVLALAALAGMQQALRDEILARTPSISVTLPPGADPLAAEQALAGEGSIVELQRVIEGRGWVVADGRAAPVRLMGYEGSPPRSLPGIRGGAPGLYLSDHLAARLGLAPGDVVTLASPRPGLTPLGPQPRLLTARLAGTYESGRIEEEPVAAMPIARAEILLGRSRAGRLLVFTRTLEQAEELAPQLQARLPQGTQVETWEELNRPLFFALALERTVLFLAVSLIVAVAAMALFSDLQLVASTKRRELALLAAMGADERALRRAFLYLGTILGVGGAVVGGAVGGVAAWALDRWHLVRLPRGLLVFDSLPFRLRVGDVVAVVGVTVALTLLCAALGATRAARLLPAEALRG